MDSRRRAETSEGTGIVPAGAPIAGKLRAQSCGEYDSRTGMMSRPNRYKTEMCRSFKDTGLCRYGRKCQFAHGEQELRAVDRHPRYKTELCKAYHNQGYCSYGIRCHFVHDEDEGSTNSTSNSTSTSTSNSTNSTGAPPVVAALTTPVYYRLQQVVQPASQSGALRPLIAPFNGVVSDLYNTQSDSAYSSSTALV